MDSIDGFNIPIWPRSESSLPMADRSLNKSSRLEKTLSETLRFLAEKNALNNEACDDSSSRDQQTQRNLPISSLCPPTTHSQCGLLTTLEPCSSEFLALLILLYPTSNIFLLVGTMLSKPYHILYTLVIHPTNPQVQVLASKQQKSFLSQLNQPHIWKCQSVRIIPDRWGYSVN